MTDLVTPPAPQLVTPSLQLLPHQTLSLLVHADSKVGKSTLAATGPKPILVLDAEGSWKFIPVRQVHWNPYQPPPAYDGTWDACVVNVNEWAAVELVYRWLTQYQLPFVTVVIDSISELQRRCKQNLKHREGVFGQAAEAMKIQDWGALLDVMAGVIRGFRDLTLLSWSPVQCVVFVAETKLSPAGKWGPYMQGQIATSLPYWVDICGYMYASQEMDANGQPTRECRRLWISPHAQFEAGERVQGRLGKEVLICKPIDGTVGRDIEDMLSRIYSLPTAVEAAQNGGPRT